MNLDPFTLPIQARQLVEASAGTGKTYAITSLYVRLVLGRGLPAPLSVEKILVLTFTVAATQELKGRINKRLLEARQALQAGSSDDHFLQQLVKSSEDPAKERKLLTGALQLMDDATIMTIHAFCSKVLGEESFEAGRLFDQAASLEGETFTLLASQDVFRKELLTLAPQMRELAQDLWESPDELLWLSKRLLGRRQLALEPAGTELQLDWEAMTKKALTAKRGWIDESLAEVIKAANLHGGKKPVRQLNAMNAFCQSESADLFDDLWQTYSTAGLEAGKKKDSKMPKHRVLKLIDEVSGYSALRDEAQVNLWHEFLDALKKRLKALKTDQNVMTMDDLLTDLLDAMERPDSGLAQRLADRWPVIMVDEFQDTDDTQTAIFNHIAEAEDHQAFLMVGDPKQAIYQFRGADIYTYLNAKAQAEKHTLTVNWRSTGPMVSATNHLFAGKQVFDAQGEIEFAKVSAAHQEPQAPLTVAGARLKPYQLLLTDLDSDSPPSLGAAQAQLMEATADKTAELLAGAAQGTVTLGDKPLTAGSIAYLVRTRAAADLAKRALARRGIPSVYLTLESVLLQDTADDLRLILQAVLEPSNHRAIKAAIATRLMLSDAQEIESLNKDVAVQQRVLEEFQRYHDLWQKEQIGAMLMALIEARGLAKKWLKLAAGERQLTNLRHLLELLQTRAALAPGMHRLLKWFIREQQAAEGQRDERQLRLESDENLVKIVTMHAAKGLEYDVVMLPHCYFSTPSNNREPLLFHRKGKDGDYQLVADVSAERAHEAEANKEARAEEMRLLYVALTRAKHLCYVGVPLVSNWSRLAKTAMAELLGLRDVDPEATPLDKHLGESLPKELFEVVSYQGAQTGVDAVASPQAVRTAPPALPEVPDLWRLHSYTSVEARLRSLPRAELAALSGGAERGGYADDDDDLGGVDAAGETAAASPGELSRFTFPRGKGVGIALHSLLEHIDFEADGSAHESACRRALVQAGIGGEQAWRAVMAEWLVDILATPLNDSLCLANLAKGDRADELEFHFPVSCAPDTFAFLQKEGFLQNRDLGSTGQIEGMMTGLIDLAFRHGGKYYLTDYKSNHLGWGFEAYSPDGLRQAMQESAYDLQYLIYAVALHRHLAQTLPDYRYETHFGGVFYLFLRGMDGQSSKTGVFFDRPDEALILALDKQMGAR